jgi:hypothetical protein
MSVDVIPSHLHHSSIDAGIFPNAAAAFLHHSKKEFSADL